MWWEETDQLRSFSWTWLKIRQKERWVGTNHPIWYLSSSPRPPTRRRPETPAHIVTGTSLPELRRAANETYSQEELVPETLRWWVQERKRSPSRRSGQWSRPLGLQSMRSILQPQVQKSNVHLLSPRASSKNNFRSWSSRWVRATWILN